MTNVTRFRPGGWWEVAEVREVKAEGSDRQNNQYVSLDNLYVITYNFFRFDERHLLMAVRHPLLSSRTTPTKEVTTDSKGHAAPTLLSPQQ